MRLSRLLLASPCLCIVLAMLGASQESAPAASDTMDVKVIDAYVTGKVRSAHISGLALAIVRGDRIVYLKWYGRADPSGRPVTPQTPFMIGSVTKSFTTLAVMQLVDAGTIELDAPVQRYIPWFRVADPEASARITVRQLLTMTSGLPQQYATQLWTADDDRAIERSVRFLKTVRLSRPVGDSFTYSNSNYETLGVLIQTVTGQSYEEYVKEHIFAPLGMRNSFASQKEAMQHGMASGHRWRFGIPVAVTFPYNRSELPAGYIISSTEDMAHYVIAQLNAGRYGSSSVLSPEGMALMHVESPPASFGMGWESIRSNGRHLINLDGGTTNFQSSLFFDPEARVGVYIAANVVNALDTFASPHGASPLDGPTARAMARTVLSLATNQLLPDQGRGHERLTLIFNLVILALTGALVILLARTPRRYRQLVQYGAESSANLGRHSGVATVAYLALPVVVVGLAIFSAPWKVIAIFQPDLAYWLYAVAIVLFLRALLEVWMAGRASRRIR